MHAKCRTYRPSHQCKEAFSRRREQAPTMTWHRRAMMIASSCDAVLCRLRACILCPCSRSRVLASPTFAEYIRTARNSTTFSRWFMLASASFQEVCEDLDEMKLRRVTSVFEGIKCVSSCRVDFAIMFAVTHCRSSLFRCCRLQSVVFSL